MKKYRYQQTRGCTRCKIPVPDGCCPKCGGTFLGDIVELDFVYKEYWIKIPIIWWKPSTWAGGYWKPEYELKKRKIKWLEK